MTHADCTPTSGDEPAPTVATAHVTHEPLARLIAPATTPLADHPCHQPTHPQAPRGCGVEAATHSSPSWVRMSVEAEFVSGTAAACAVALVCSFLALALFVQVQPSWSQDSIPLGPSLSAPLAPLGQTPFHSLDSPPLLRRSLLRRRTDGSSRGPEPAARRPRHPAN